MNIDMKAGIKIGVSTLGIFLGGLTQYYQIHYALHPELPVLWLPLLMAGLTPLAGYFVGLFQRAPGDTGPK